MSTVLTVCTLPFGTISVADSSCTETGELNRTYNGAESQILLNV